MRRGSRVAIGAAVGVLAAVGLAATATAALGIIVARRVLVPPSRREEDIAILRVDLDARLVTLQSTPDSRLPGDYSFWFSRESGHARIGEIVAQDEHTVTRRILAVDFGDLDRARRGRLTGWYYLTPADLPLPFRAISIGTPLGDAPAWLIPAGEGEHGSGDRWAIHVHGRAVRRPETLRAVPVFHEAGFTSLVVSYRNDGEAPRSSDFRYALGDREWRDVEAAMRYALARGARELVLMGWSMGGATVLQALTRSAYRDRIVGVVLESPVVDWIAALDFQVRLRRLPVLIRSVMVLLFKHPWGRIFTGLAEPLDIDRLDFVTRARELDTPVLILHSDDDGFVPATASRALAVARPDLVTFEAFEVARHTKLWNYDRRRWEGAIRGWLERLPQASSRRGRQRA